MKTGGMRLEGVYSRPHVIPNQPRRGKSAMPWAVAGGMNSVSFSIPDLAPVSGKGDTTEARRFTTELARRAATATRTIRVGSGGVMLPHHAPLVVAEQFDTLESLYPGRPDRPAAVLRADRGTQPRSGRGVAASEFGRGAQRCWLSAPESGFPRASERDHSRDSANRSASVSGANSSPGGQSSTRSIAMAVRREQLTRRPVTRWFTVEWLKPALRATWRSDRPKRSM